MKKPSPSIFFVQGETFPAIVRLIADMLRSSPRLSVLAALGHLSRRERQGMLPPCLFAFSSSPLVCGLIFFRAKPLTFRAALPILSGWAAHAARLSNDSQEHCFIWITTF